MKVWQIISDCWQGRVSIAKIRDYWFLLNLLMTPLVAIVYFPLMIWITKGYILLAVVFVVPLVIWIMPTIFSCAIVLTSPVTLIALVQCYRNQQYKTTSEFWLTTSAILVAIGVALLWSYVCLGGALAALFKWIVSSIGSPR